MGPIRKGAQDGRQQTAGTANEWNKLRNYHHATYYKQVEQVDQQKHGPAKQGHLTPPRYLLLLLYMYMHIIMYIIIMYNK